LSTTALAEQAGAIEGQRADRMRRIADGETGGVIEIDDAATAQRHRLRAGKFGEQA
jgi:hypothetical protein